MIDLSINLVEHQLPFAQRTHAPITLLGKKEYRLIDSGAMGYYIDQTLVRKLNVPTERLINPITIYNVDHTENIVGKIKE